MESLFNGEMKKMDIAIGLTLATVLIAISGFLHLWGSYKDKDWLFYIFKPVTTLSIAALCYFLAPELNTYVYLIIAGLILSTFGDIFLMLPKDRFIPGLASFLVAHVLYIIAFSGSFEITYTLTVIVPLVICGLIVLSILWPTLNEMAIPVVVYMSVIIVMAWLGCERYLAFDDSASLYAAIGALVFLFSDATLAFDRFKMQFKSAYAWIIVSYYVAQYFIAISVM